MEKISRTKIVDVLKREDFGAMVNVKGWVRTRRGSKQVNFIALNDGSTINNVQVVVDLANFDEEMLKDITTGACLSVNGELTESVGSGQKAEIQAREIEVLGTCDNTYPLQKKGHTLEFLREIAHLRPRTNTFGAVFRIRHNMAIAIHTFFHQKGFVYFHTPIITASDCEGAGQMFQVTTKNLYDLKKDEAGSIIYDDDFFGKQTSLTVSGQLEGELAATALGAIYTFGPTFRAENSNTPRHLAEFWMVEPEVAFNDITDNMDLAEEFIKFCVKWALDNCADDVKFLNDMFDKGLIERLQGVLKESFVRLGDIRLDKQVEQLQEVTVLGSNEIKMEDKTMYSTPVVWFAEVKEDAPTGYHELTLSLSLTVVNFPDNVSYTGASPKISDKNTWLVYDDDLNAYVDTGIEVGYANLLSRYDGKFAEIVVPCTEATNAAAAATVAANNAAAAANRAAGSASAATAAANTAAGKANTATTAANNAATAANTATGKANEAATAANNAAESAQRVVDTYDDVINTLAHSDCTLDERVEALEKALIAVLSGAVVIPKLQIKELNVWGNNSLALVGDSAPTKAPDRAGQFYIDKTARALYFSTGNAAVSDWKIQ